MMTAMTEGHIQLLHRYIGYGSRNSHHYKYHTARYRARPYISRYLIEQPVEDRKYNVSTALNMTAAMTEGCFDYAQQDNR